MVDCPPAPVSRVKTGEAQIGNPMSSITDYFGIPGDVPFLDIEVDADNLAFLDLHAIRLSTGPEPFRAEALLQADSFMSTIVAYVHAGSGSSFELGRALLSQFSEPWETRLGMSKDGYFGHGGSDGVGADIWDALVTDRRALVEVGLLSQLDRIPLYVSGIGSDITSDLTTRVTYSALAGFTAAMLGEYPQLSYGALPVDAKMWNPETRDWVVRSVELPSANGKPLLLVPRDWARRNPLVTAGRFHKKSVLGHVQDVEATVSSVTGRVTRSPKWALQQRQDLRNVHDSNARVSLSALDSGQDLPSAFEAYLAGWLREQDRRHKS